MNTKKHKNKKVNRQPNLNILQKDDTTASDIRTDTHISHTECDTKGESVQDNDVIKQVDERHEEEVITPKKPKRKKGKKKEDKEEECDNDQDKLLKTIKVENEAFVESENVHQDVPEVIPVRKKKNKKKGGDVGSEKKLLLDQKHDDIQIVEATETASKTDKSNIYLPKIETVEEINIAKKKNKRKKNRTDSEKSDKSVGTVSCTSAFQMLLDANDDDRSDDNIKEFDLESVSKNDNNTSDILQVGTEIKFEDKSKKLEESNTIVELKTNVLENLHSIDDDNNNKNENIQSSKTIDLFQEYQNDSQKISVDETAEIILACVDTVSDSGTKSEIFSIEEDKLKCRAKIVKPVEKKRKKDGQESQVKNLTEGTSLEIDSQTSSNEEIIENIAAGNAPEEKIEGSNIMATHILDKSKETEQCITTTREDSHTIIGNINQKPPNVPDVAKTVSNITEQTHLEEDIQKEKVEATSDVVKDELIFESLVPLDFASESSEDKLNEILNIIAEPIENDKNKEFIKTESKQLSGNNEKRRKKGKKTPKILINPDTTTNIVFEEKEHIKPSEIDDKSSMLTPSEDIEIRSVKADESEGSTCDVTPEILHPRSTSEHLKDDNNNTIIQEVFEDTLNIPLSPENIPLIEGSGETPTDIPETISSGIKLVEIENISANLQEKTDIRSKMMEVNKDMEELRSSIEKSLAELTALQKNEEISEKQFKEKHEIEINNENIVDTHDIIPKDTVLSPSDSDIAHAVDESTISIKYEKMSEKGEKSTEYNDAEKSSVNIDQLHLEEVKHIDIKSDEATINEDLIKEDSTDVIPPICPVRKDHKKSKKRKGRQEASQISNTVPSTLSHISTQDTKTGEKCQESTETSEQKGEQQSSTCENDNKTVNEDDHHSNNNEAADYEPIENFEDALTSSADDINQTFEMIVNQVTEESQQQLAFLKPEINIIEPSEESEKKGVEENPVTPSKNLLGRPDIPARSNKTDYKKEKDKSPDTKQAKVQIKDNVEIEISKESKESQTEKKKEEKLKKQLRDEEYFCQISNCDDFIYKYSFRRVFLQSACHVCKKELTRFRVPCKFCSLVFYCSLKHKDDDWPKHQALCFAVSTIVHIKGQKHIYADAKNITGHNYRLLRMQAILGCEKVLKRRLIPWEQEVLLYPRMCADVSCREWRQSKLKDCEGCGQISYCSANADHLPKSHQRWCKSYSLYQKLVLHQQTKGRLEPKLPSKVLKEYQIPEKINEVLATMFEEKIDLNDVQYAALTQIATAPLTVAFCDQIYRSKKKCATIDKNKSSAFVIHVVGAELQFEADVLNKWEIYFLHLRSDVKELRVVLISPDLNPGKLPLDLLGRIRLCENCRQNKRRVVFNFQDNKTYQEYRNSDDFIYPDIVCAFNPGLHRASVYNGKDPWPATINTVIKLKCPFVITSHTITELNRDLVRLKEFAELEVIVGPRPNPFSSVRPDRNFISDDEVPLLFKNHCFMILFGL